MTKKEMIKAYQKSLKKIEEDQAHFEELGEDFLVGQYNIYIKLLRMFIKDLEKLDQQSLAMETKDIRRLYSSLRVQCKEIGLVNLLAGFSLYLDAEIDFYDMQASEENREPLKSVFRNEFEKLSSMKSDIDTCINALVNKGDKE